MKYSSSESSSDSAIEIEDEDSQSDTELNAPNENLIVFTVEFRNALLKLRQVLQNKFAKFNMALRRLYKLKIFDAVEVHYMAGLIYFKKVKHQYVYDYVLKLLDVIDSDLLTPTMNDIFIYLYLGNTLNNLLDIIIDE